MADESWRDAVHRELSRPSKRGQQPYDTGQWKARRNALKDGAVCVLCARFGLQVPAQVADHVVPAMDSGFEGALQPLCLDCHKLKRKIEGRWRRGELGVAELDLSISREGARLRAAAFGVGVDGLSIVPYPRSR